MYAPVSCGFLNYLLQKLHENLQDGGQGKDNNEVKEKKAEARKKKIEENEEEDE